MIVEVALPSTLYTFRGYEAIIFNSKIPHLGHFYPNYSIVKYAEGDLCHHSCNSIIKKEIWKTDEIGFRNDKFIKKPDVVLIGSSFIYGTGMTQTDVISNQLSKYLNNKFTVYNLAPSNLAEFDYYLREGIIKKPKLIVYCVGEIQPSGGFVPFSKLTNSFIKKKVKNFLCSNSINSIIDRTTRFYSIKWIKARLKKLENIGVRGEVNKKMFFAQGKKSTTIKGQRFELSIKNIKSCKRYCDSLGIKFLYLETPKKETVYYDFVPLKNQSSYLLKLRERLIQLNIKGIYSLSVFNKFRQTDNRLLYHLDDTHWNSLGVKLVSKEMADIILKLKL